VGPGQPRLKTAAIGVTAPNYLYDVAGGLPVLLSDGARKYVWGLGLAYAVVSGTNALEVYRADGLGSVRAVTDGSRALIATYQTDAYGVPTATWGPRSWAGSRPAARATPSMCW